ncbi:MAG: ABC transporter permease subunit [Eubacteriales bacterium]|nr:ABC transporter permease subunit [Eubacteriales bacterium]
MNDRLALRPNAFQRWRKNIVRCKYLYLMILLPLAWLLLFKYGPMYGMQVAFRNFRVRKGIWGSDWVGLKYFQQYLSDPGFWKIARNTIVLGFYQVVFYFPIPIIFALLMNEMRSKGAQRLEQNISYLPHFISVVVIASMTISFLAKDGLINQMIVSLGGTAYTYMQNPNYFRFIYISTDIWQEMGWSAIIYTAALTNVDTQLYDAAVVDGAGRLQQTLHITIPAILPTIAIMFIMKMGGILNLSFEKTLLLQNALTYDTSDIISTYVYRKGLSGSQFSYSTAVDMFSTIINLIFLLTTNMLCRKFGDTSLW